MSRTKPVAVGMLESRQTRRRAAQSLAAAGSLLFVTAVAGERSLLVLAQDSDEDDSSGRGRGRGRGRGGDDQDNSGPGNADDPETRDEEDAPVPVSGVVPEVAVEVRIVSDDADGFVPGELTVDLGQTVAFVNAHDDEHTATGSGFDTGVINPGQVATVVLDTPGSFAYACQIHPEMTGRIGVRGEDGVVPQTQQAAQDAPADAAPVRIINLSFDPPELNVPTGTAVAWANEDTVPHTVTSVDGIFDSSIFDPGGSFSWTFDQPGTFPYVCQLHPQMQGTVIVEGEATAGASTAPAAGDESEPASQQTAAPGELAVSIVDFAFEPAALEVSDGATVVWTNEGQAPHTVTGDFADSGILKPGQTFSHTFTESGEFPYVCAIHPQMEGTVSVSTGTGVEPAGATPVAAPAAGPEGVWLFSLLPDDESVLGAQQALVAFEQTGSVEADFTPGPGSDAPATTLSAGRGEWVVRDQVCHVALVALMNDANNRFAGTVTIEAQGQLDLESRSIDGTFQFTVLSPVGKTLSQGLGTARGGSVPLDP
ncbi:MAG: cupredoxin domain-containing protein [Chloroflexi bacterium]|nr:cupredoxin domain-containing protein [Chloroflexota bacterium]